MDMGVVKINVDENLSYYTGKVRRVTGEMLIRCVAHCARTKLHCTVIWGARTILYVHCSVTKRLSVFNCIVRQSMQRCILRETFC